jgi:hypothetical protein
LRPAATLTVGAAAICYGHSLIDVKLFGHTPSAYDGRKILQLNRNDFLRLRAARGVAIEVLAGRVWITEDGRAADSFLGPGRRYRIGGQGLVLVGTEVFAGDGEGAEIALRAA